MGEHISTRAIPPFESEVFKAFQMKVASGHRNQVGVTSQIVAAALRSTIPSSSAVAAIVSAGAFNPGALYEIYRRNSRALSVASIFGLATYSYRAFQISEVMRSYSQAASALGTTLRRAEAPSAAYMAMRASLKSYSNSLESITQTLRLVQMAQQIATASVEPTVPQDTRRSSVASTHLRSMVTSLRLISDMTPLEFVVTLVALWHAALVLLPNQRDQDKARALVYALVALFLLRVISEPRRHDDE